MAKSTNKGTERRYKMNLDAVIQASIYKDDFSGTHYEPYEIGLVSAVREPDTTLKIDAPLPQILEDLDACNKLECLIARTAKLLRRIGITDFGHVKLTRKVDALDVIGTYDSGLIDRYRRESFHQVDLVFDALLCGGAAMFRSEVDDHVANAGFKTEAYIHHREYCEYLRRQGIHEVYCYPIPESDPPALFVCSTPSMEKERFQDIVRENLSAIHNLARAFHGIGSSRFSTHFHSVRGNRHIPLRDRALELLEILARKDVTLNEAAEILSMSISTANQHIAFAKKRLHASTMHGLIVAAYREGLLGL